MKKVYLDDSFDGRKMEHIDPPKKVNVQQATEQVLAQIEEKLRERKAVASA